MSASKDIHLVGAGLAGSLLSCYLAKKNFQVTAWERRPDMRVEKISAGRSINLALAERGIFPLKEVGLFDRVQKLLIPMKGRMIHDLKGNLTFQAYSRNENEMIYSVSRGQLTMELLSAAEATGNVKIHFHEKCVGVDFENNRLELFNEIKKEKHFVGAPVVIGTDGSASAIRASMAETPDFTFTEEHLSHGYKELNIPAGANGAFQMEKNALHIWPRGTHMLIALPNLDGSFTVTLFLPFKGEAKRQPSFENLIDQAAVRSFFETQFQDALKLMPNLVEDFFHNPTGSMVTVRCSRWHEKNALLLGDAAHAIVPFHGQGMNCAFEDASVLNACLDGSATMSWPQLFQKFQDLRRVNANAIADMALENYVEMRDSVRDPKFHLKKKIEWMLEERYPKRILSRYAMVMFRRIPYAEVQRRGEIQKQILERLSSSIQSLDQLDFALVDQMIEMLPLNL